MGYEGYSGGRGHLEGLAAGELLAELELLVVVVDSVADVVLDSVVDDVVVDVDESVVLLQV